MTLDCCFSQNLPKKQKINQMKNYLPLFLFAGCLLGCQPASPPSNATGDARFHTTDPGRLYFKNMRSSAYAMEEQAKTRIELYQLRRFSSTAQRPVFIPVIANNWLADEAYLFIQTNEFERGFAVPLTYIWEGSGLQGLSSLQPASIGRQYEFAMELYEHLAQKHVLQVLCADSTLAPLFENQEDRLHFMTTIRDYRRLTE
jgi:hypothetical protein